MKVGHDFKTDYTTETALNIIDIGGYKVIQDIDKGVLVQGLKLINLFDFNIDYISIVPLDEDTMKSAGASFPFDIETHHLVYQISNNGYAWYFNNKQDAYSMMKVFLQVKELALHQKWIEQHKETL
jgi:hypothetical protein